MMSEIPFGEWLPDQADYRNPGLITAENCYPVSGGYGPLASPVGQGATTTEQVTGAQMFFDASANAVIVGGSATRLFTSRSGTVTETTGYTTTANGWKFERFNDLVIGVSLENDPQYLTDVDSDDTWSTLPGSPPKAAQVGKVDDFLVFGDLEDVAEQGNATVPYRVRWGAKNDPTQSWVTDRGELSDFRDLDRRHGRVTGIVGGRWGLVFQERAIWRMVFVGSPKVFEFEPISDAIGCVAPGSIVTIGTDTYFQAQDGMYRTNGSTVEAIGGSRVNEWLLEEMDSGDRRRTHGAINWLGKSIVWSFPKSTGQTCQLIYNFVLDRFSSARQLLHHLVQSRLNGETLASLAALFPGGIGDMSAFTLGNSEWKAEDLSFAAFVESGNGSELAEFSGVATAAAFETGDAMLEPGRRALVTGLWPVLETAESTMTTSVRTRAQEGGLVTVSTASVKAADGWCPHHVDGWLHGARLNIPAGAAWNKAQAVRVRAVLTGRR